jgi:hypothetical protein
MQYYTSKSKQIKESSSGVEDTRVVVQIAEAVDNVH